MVDSQITIRSKQGRDSMVSFESKSNSTKEMDYFKIGLSDSSQKFIIKKGEQELLSMNTSVTNVSNTLFVKEELQISKDSDLKINGIAQWMLVH